MAVNRIAIVAGTLGQGGAERQLIYILSALRGMGIEATVYALTSGEFYEDAVRESGAHLVHITAAGRVGRFLQIARLVKRQEPDAVMSMHFFTNLYAYAAAQYSAVPSIGALRSNCTAEIADVGRFGRQCLTAPAYVAANSRAAMRSAAEVGRSPETLFYLGNVVDTERFHPQHRNASGVRPEVLYIGRLVPEKRLDRLIRLMAKLGREMDVHCTIIGKGPLEDALKQQVSKNNLGNASITFQGPVADVAPALYSASMLLLTSDYEGTPNVILEAQAAGVPVVATAAGGVPAIVQHRETGILVQPDDEDGLYRGAVEVLTQPAVAERYASAARAMIEQEHSIASLSRTLTRIFSNIT